MLDQFTLTMLGGLVLGVVVALSVGLSGGSSHLAACRAEQERERRIQERWKALRDAGY